MTAVSKEDENKFKLQLAQARVEDAKRSHMAAILAVRKCQHVADQSFDNLVIAQRECVRLFELVVATTPDS